MAIEDELFYSLVLNAIETNIGVWTWVKRKFTHKRNCLVGWFVLYACFKCNLRQNWYSDFKRTENHLTNITVIEIWLPW